MNDKPLVIVEWTDAGCDSSWQTPGTILTPSKCHTAGWLLHQDDDMLMVAATFTENGDFNQTMSIPRGMVVKVENVTS